MMTELCLSKLPVGRFVRYEKITVQSQWALSEDEKKTVDVVVWDMTGHGYRRLGQFDVKTGEYMGDTF